MLFFGGPRYSRSSPMEKHMISIPHFPGFPGNGLVRDKSFPRQIFRTGLCVTVHEDRPS
jgi:hypothetical protein